MSMPFVNIKHILIACVFIVLSGCGLFQTKPEVVDNHLETEAAIDPELQSLFADALALLRDEKFEEAEQQLLAITSAYPDFAGPWSNLAIAQLSLKKYDISLVSINISLEADQGFCSSLSLKGVILRELGKFEEAKASYLKAVECNPKDNLSIYNLGVLADLYMHDEISALFYYQTYLANQSESKDSVVETWVVDLKRRVPEEQRIAVATKVVAPNSTMDKLSAENITADASKAESEKIDSESVVLENNEPQLAGEE